ncbi:uncharacterized protein NECHADRAFT_31765, partial [Fusarium vanettenii 77-13-4]
YDKGSPERAELTKALKKLHQSSPVKIPFKIGGQVANNNTTSKQPNPSQHSEIVAEYASATPENVQASIDAALKAKADWEATPFEDRAAIFLRACDLITGKYRAEIVAATMLGQGKNIREAEIDAAVESVDFFRQYIKECTEMFAQQPKLHEKSSWNRMEYRPLEGFVYAVSPFNFTALGATLVGPAALLGNVVVWKPSDSALHANHLFYKILLEAGLPPNVVQFVPGDAETVTDAVMSRPEFGALTFIGSTAVFKNLIGKIGQGTAEGRFNSYPRIIGESGGKNFHLIHGSANVKSAALDTLRSAFEYQGQKCSAVSRVYVAESVWPEFKKVIQEETKNIKVGPPDDYASFVNAVIHERAFDRLDDVIQKAKNDPELELIAGGETSKSKGYFIHPTIFRTTNPNHDIMKRELFGPLFAVHVYPDSEYSSILKTIDKSKYALTGSVFAKDIKAAREAQNVLKHTAGNFYINTKSTGSIVGQQPFGGSRDSGSNDKTGTIGLISRYCSIRTIKEEFGSTEELQYPSNEV